MELGGNKGKLEGKSLSNILKGSIELFILQLTSSELRAIDMMPACVK